MRALCVDIVERVPEFHHVRMEQVAVCFAQARRRVPYGLQAKLTPMRFADGQLVTERPDGRWTVRRLFQGEQEILYLLTFYLPRFQDQSREEKLVTVCHELYHISPRFNGDIRRLAGRYHVHQHSQKEYDAQMAVFARQYLATRPSRAIWSFLEHDFETLSNTHGGVAGLRLPIPRLIRLEKPKAA